MPFTYRTRFLTAIFVCIAACVSVAVTRADTTPPAPHIVTTVAAIGDDYPEGPDSLTVALTEQRTAYADWLVFLGHAVDEIVAGWTPPPPPVVYPLPRQYAAVGSTVGECSGFAIPDYIIQRESGGNASAYNPSGAYGCAQTLLGHYNPGGSCAGLNPYDIQGQRDCVNILSNGGTNLAPWSTR